jgi:hypothetical protein
MAPIQTKRVWMLTVIQDPEARLAGAAALCRRHVSDLPFDGLSIRSTLTLLDAVPLINLRSGSMML